MGDYSQFKGQPRLPEFAIPKRYDLKLKPDLIACTFTGTVEINLEIISDTKFLVLNASELTIDHKSVYFTNPDACLSKTEGAVSKIKFSHPQRISACSSSGNLAQ